MDKGISSSSDTIPAVNPTISRAILMCFLTSVLSLADLRIYILALIFSCFSLQGWTRRMRVVRCASRRAGSRRTERKRRRTKAAMLPYINTWTKLWPTMTRPRTWVRRRVRRDRRFRWKFCRDRLGLGLGQFTMCEI